MTTQKLAINLTGTTLGGRYFLEKLVGSGGFATVYRARDNQFHLKIVAVKVLNPEHARDEEDRQRFMNEATIGGQIEDENEHLVRVSDHGDSDGHLYYVMEYLHGTNLRQELEKSQGRSLPWPKALQVAEQLCEALQVTHRHGIIHRDLKPENVVLVRRKGLEHVKLLDLGIAKLLNSDSIQGQYRISSKTGSIIGSAHYMSPEQVQGKGCDGRADIYSLGVVLYEMLTGRVPFSSPNEFDILHGHVKEPPPWFVAVNPGLHVPRGVEDLVRKALAKAPEDRFLDVGEMREALCRELSYGQLGQGHQRRVVVSRFTQDLLADQPTPKRTLPAGGRTIRPSLAAGEPSTIPAAAGPPTLLPVEPLPLLPTDPTPTTKSRERRKAKTIDSDVQDPGNLQILVEDAAELPVRGDALLSLGGLMLIGVLSACPMGMAVGMVVQPDLIAHVRALSVEKKVRMQPPEPQATRQAVVPTLGIDEPLEAKPGQPAPPSTDAPKDEQSPKDAGVAEEAPVVVVDTGIPDFKYTAAKFLIDEQVAYLRETCMSNSGKPLRRLKMTFVVAPSGARKISVEPESAKGCVLRALAFSFARSPNGGTFHYVLPLQGRSVITPISVPTPVAAQVGPSGV